MFLVSVYGLPPHYRTQMTHCVPVLGGLVKGVLHARTDIRPVIHQERGHVEPERGKVVSRRGGWLSLRSLMPPLSRLASPVNPATTLRDSPNQLTDLPWEHAQRRAKLSDACTFAPFCSSRASTARWLGLSEAMAADSAMLPPAHTSAPASSRGKDGGRGLGGDSLLNCL